MVKIILNRLSYFEKDDYWGHIFYCDEFDILPTIDILYGGYWVEINPADYTINFDGTSCGLVITDSGNTNYAVFGDVFMRNYYVVFD